MSRADSRGDGVRRRSLCRPASTSPATSRCSQPETPRAKTFTLTLPRWVAHRPGQHYDVRLTAPDGYQAQRSYSVASEPERVGEIDLTVERLEDGEVSSYLHDVLVPGDLIEVRGPIGGYFVWDVGIGGPLLLIAGGSGVVPLMAMLRHRQAVHSRVPARLLYSVRGPDDVIFADELLCGREGALATLLAFTQAPGVVLRCPACESVVLRIVQTPEAIFLDARGTLYLRLGRRLS